MYGGGPSYTSYGGSDGYPQHIPNYRIPSILVTIFCCLPLGIAAIIFAAQVDGKVAPAISRPHSRHPARQGP